LRLRRATSSVAGGPGLRYLRRICQGFEDVCRETLSSLPKRAKVLEVTLDTFHDRIEISIHHHGQMVLRLARGLRVQRISCGWAGRLNGLELLSRVDRVLFQCRRRCGADYAGKVFASEAVNLTCLTSSFLYGVAGQCNGEKPSCVIILMSPLAGRQAKRRRIPHTPVYDQEGFLTRCSGFGMTTPNRLFPYTVSVP